MWFAVLSCAISLDQSVCRSYQLVDRRKLKLKFGVGVGLYRVGQKLAGGVGGKSGSGVKLILSESRAKPSRGESRRVESAADLCFSFSCDEGGKVRWRWR